ncbi:MAG: OsmC family protein [Hyphomonadaceae bacterium]|nr:OsmC family protein [Hyphomonadaceae bacterium]
MASHDATISWKRGDASFADGKYSRFHEISFDGGAIMPGSSSPSVVREPMSRADAVDPEEMLVAALSSCHMLTFLDLARRDGFVIDSYVDAAKGVMEKIGEHRFALTRVTLRPQIAWGGDKRPTPAELEDLHHRSHELCFIANSFKGDVTVEAAP